MINIKHDSKQLMIVKNKNDDIDNNNYNAFIDHCMQFIERER